MYKKSNAIIRFLMGKPIITLVVTDNTIEALKELIRKGELLEHVGYNVRLVSLKGLLDY